MKKIFIILGILLLEIISYAKEEDILGTWLIKENGKVKFKYSDEHRSEFLCRKRTKILEIIIPTNAGKYTFSF